MKVQTVVNHYINETFIINNKTYRIIDKQQVYPVEARTRLARYYGTVDIGTLFTLLDLQSNQILRINICELKVLLGEYDLDENIQQYNKKKKKLSIFADPDWAMLTFGFMGLICYSVIIVVISFMVF